MIEEAFYKAPPWEAPQGITLGEKLLFTSFIRPPSFGEKHLTLTPSKIRDFLEPKQVEAEPFK